MSYCLLNDSELLRLLTELLKLSNYSYSRAPTTATYSQILPFLEQFPAVSTN